MQIITIQRLGRNKRPFDTVEIIKRIKEKYDITFVWIGSGEEHDVATYSPAIKSVGIWMPEVSEIEKWDCLMNSDIYINTSELEGFNCGVAEALSLGMPTLVYDLLVYRNVYESCPIYVPLYDINSFVARLGDVITNYEVYKKRYSERSVRFIDEQYGMDRLTERIIDILRSVVNKHERKIS